MPMQLELTRIFVKIVQLGSFSRAADLMRLPKSTVSRAVSRLEIETGTKLLVRTTRSLTLTAAGKVFYDTCLRPVQILEDAHKSLQGQDSILAGHVRLTAPEDLGSLIIAPAIGRLTRQHAGLSFELNYTDEIVDLVRDGYDLAVRIGKLNTSSFKSKRLGEIVLVTVASPDYLKDRGKPKKPHDLSDHECLSYTQAAQSPRWTLRSKSATANVNIKPRIVANQMTSLMRMAISGAGIAFVPHYLCQEYLRTGKLTRVLEDWSGVGLPVSILSPLSSSTSARLKIAMDYLSAAIHNAL
jgi:LysR family transcriptional regulator for bpeEF and oprC